MTAAPDLRNLPSAPRPGLEAQAARLRDRLAEVGLSQADFARLRRQSKTAVSLWCRALRPVPADVWPFLDLFARLTPAGRAETLMEARAEAGVPGPPDLDKVAGHLEDLYRHVPEAERPPEVAALIRRARR